MDRLQQKNELFMKLGALFGPLQRLVAHPEEYNEQESAEVIARYCAEWDHLNDEFRKFCNGQIGHKYAVQYSQFARALSWFQSGLIDGLELPKLFEEYLPIMQAAIAEVPIPKTSEILEAGSPFTAFCKIKDLVEGDAAHEIIWIDAYMDLNIFRRFLRGVASGVAITLVTEEPRANASRRDRDRWTTFLDISRLFAQERGTNSYRLIVHSSGILHDRWLLLDGKRLFHLGGSAKDAADKSYFTLGRLDASPANVSQIQLHVSSGIEYYGSNTPAHR